MRRHELAHAAWPVLCEIAKKREVITYENLAHRLGYEQAATTMKNALGPIQNLCIARGYPALTSLVVNKNSKKPGDGFIRRDDTVTAGQHRAWEFDWGAVPAPSLHQFHLVSAAPIRAPTEQPEDLKDDSAEVLAEAPLRPWHWEGHVQARVVDSLKDRGWDIVSTSDTASRAQGVDVIARKGGTELWVSVKGFPVATPKTQPALQARHWFAGALFDMILYRGESSVQLAIALPAGFVTYETLARRTAWLRKSTPFSILWVNESGDTHEKG